MTEIVSARAAEVDTADPHHGGPDPMLVATVVERHLRQVGWSVTITPTNSDEVMRAARSLAAAYGGLLAPIAGPVVDGERPDGYDHHEAVGSTVAELKAFGDDLDRSQARTLLALWWRRSILSSPQEWTAVLRRFPRAVTVRECNR